VEVTPAVADRGSEIRSLLADLLGKKGDTATFSDDESLVLSGRLQSIDVLQLVLLLEARFGIDFSERGFDQTKLDSVRDILQVIAESRT